MSVRNILAHAGPKMGLNPAIESQRSVLLRFLNEAAFDLYTESDPSNSLMEQYFVVNGDQTISLPHFVGEIRAVREAYSQVPWSINQLRPRYNISNWQDMWRNWRLKGRQPLQRTITNESILKIVVPEVEDPPITITIKGPTELGSSVEEVVTIDALTVQTVNAFVGDLTSISKSKITTYDVTINDVDDELLTVIPNNVLQPWYQIVDISTLPWLQLRNSTLDHYVEVLYKKALPYLSEDADEYPAQGYDTIVANKMLQIWAQDRGDAKLAAQYDALVTRASGRKQQEANRATEDTIALVPNPHDTLLARVRSRRPGRYGGYGPSAYS